MAEMTQDFKARTRYDGVNAIQDAQIGRISQRAPLCCTVLRACLTLTSYRRTSINRAELQGAAAVRVQQLDCRLCRVGARLCVVQLHSSRTFHTA